MLATYNIAIPPAVEKPLETLLATYGAPVLLGKKPAALFARPLWWDETVCLPGARRGLRFLNLARPGKNALIFVFRPALLARTLENPQVSKVLADLDYPGPAGSETYVAGLARRFKESREFPHEVGLFLGYPPSDVLGFMRHRGTHCKLCGLWKVYSDVERAAALFEDYDRCKRRLLEYLRRGGTIFDEALSAVAAEPL
jgi:hypothetical protein